MFRRFVSPTANRLFAARGCATAANTTGGGKPPQRGNRRPGQGVDRTLLPPAFDIVKTNDTDLEKGYMLRGQYLNNCVVLNYMKQDKTTEEVQSTSGAAARKFNSTNKVAVFLPTMFIARFLGVLEGSSDKCDIASRTTQGSFAAGSEPGTFVISATTNRGDDHEPLKWECELDAGSALMMQRFMIQALHHNSGF